MKRTAIAVVVAIALTATVTAAAATSSSNTIKGCWNLKTRVLTLRSGSSCSSGTRAIEWNITGPQGIQGKQGVRGVQGKQGVRGIQGKQGEPGTALAWAWVTGAGAVFLSTPNVTSVTADVAGHTGLYCVHLSTKTANVATVSIADSPEGGSVIGDPGWVATAEVVGIYDSSDGCSDGVAIQTLVTIPGTTSSNGSVSGEDESFYLVVD